ncbi:hypothetical protein EI94DRAFT_1566877 [Lactarius quietus]|nr:hypothetical protein EI94DRAFT_1566877 [Lactarius quietus]
MASTINFPSTEHRHQHTKSDASLVTRHTAAVEVCNLVYSQADPVSWDTLSRFYEADAGKNPIITATSRDAIGDVHSLSQHFAEIDAPKPTSLLRSLVGWARSPAERDSWFQISRMWTEVDEVCESESFDGHKRCIVEHTLNILIFPGLHERFLGHMNAAQPYALTSDSQRNSTTRSLHLSISSISGPSPPTLTVPGIGLPFPSPLHLKLHVFTRLSFNEQGRIIHHRDVWDLKDLVGLIPGGMLSQWVASRLAARVFSAISRLVVWESDEKERGKVVESSRKHGASQ